MGVDDLGLRVPFVPLALLLAGEVAFFFERFTADFPHFVNAGEALVDHLLQERGLFGHDDFFLSVLLADQGVAIGSPKRIRSSHSRRSAS